jgi:hypothetical protein
MGTRVIRVVILLLVRWLSLIILINQIILSTFRLFWTGIRAYWADCVPERKVNNPNNPDNPSNPNNSSKLSNKLIILVFLIILIVLITPMTLLFDPQVITTGYDLYHVV